MEEKTYYRIILKNEEKSDIFLLLKQYVVWYQQLKYFPIDEAKREKIGNSCFIDIEIDARFSGITPKHLALATELIHVISEIHPNGYNQPLNEWDKEIRVNASRKIDEFFDQKKLDKSTFDELVKTADFFSIQIVYNACQYWMSDFLSKKSKEEILQYFRLKCDISEEEEQKINANFAFINEIPSVIYPSSHF